MAVYRTENTHALRASTAGTINAEMQVVKNRMSALSAKAATNSVNGDDLRFEKNYLEDVRDQFGIWAGLTGISAALREQYVVQDPAYDPVAALTDVRNAIVSLSDWIGDNIPKDAQGNLLIEVITARRIVAKTFTPAANAAIKTRADAIVALIS